jgi:hypothetical protein
MRGGLRLTPVEKVGHSGIFVVVGFGEEVDGVHEGTVEVAIGTVVVGERAHSLFTCRKS